MSSKLETDPLKRIPEIKEYMKRQKEEVGQVHNFLNANSRVLQKGDGFVIIQTPGGRFRRETKPDGSLSRLIRLD